MSAVPKPIFSTEVEADSHHPLACTPLEHRQKLELYGLLSAGVAHDLANVASVITGYTSLAGSACPPNSNAAEHIRRIEDGVEILAAMCRRLISYTQQKDSDMVRYDLNSLVKGTLKLVRARLGKVRLVQQYPRADLFVSADLVQIYQVVMNLTLNASQACHEEEGEIRVVTGADIINCGRTQRGENAQNCRPGEYARLDVHDNGIGMTEETLEKAFAPFFTTKATGHGVGLASVQEVIHRHRGHIFARSTLGQGSCFTVLLPLLQPTS